MYTHNCRQCGGIGTRCTSRAPSVSASLGYLWVFVCGWRRGVAGGAGLLGLGGVQGWLPPVPRGPPMALPLPLGVFGSAAAAVSPLLVQLNLAKVGAGTDNWYKYD